MNSSSNETYYGDDWGISEDFRIFNVTFLSIVAVAIVIGNTIALHAFIVSPELKRNTYYFIASLCVSDLMIAVLSIPVWLMQMMTGFKNPHLTTFHGCLDIFTGTLSIMSLAMIGIERFICIKYALRYYQIMTTRRVLYIIVCIVIYASVCTAVNYLTSEYTMWEYPKVFITLESTILVMAFGVPVAIKLFAYGNIFKEAKKQVAEIQKLERFNISSNSDDGDQYSSSQDLNDSDSVIMKTHHSQSRVSWTTSPLARRKHETGNKQTKFQRTESDVSDFDDEIDDDKICQESKGLLSNKLRFFLQKGHSCFSKRKANKSRTLDCNDNNKLSFDENNQDVCSDGSNDSKILNRKDTDTSIKSKILDRKNTDTSIKSILKKTSRDEESCYLMEMSSSDEPRKESGDMYSNNDKRQKREKTVSMQEKQLTFTRNNNHKVEEERDRSVSCPTGKPVRQSLDVTGLPNGKIMTDKVKNGSSSPFLRRFRASSKWSPSNSPLVVRKNRDKQKKQEQRIRRFKKELRAAKVVGLIMGTFLVCWTPFMVFILLYTLQYKWQFDYGGLKSISIAIDFHYLNSAINPVLYVLLNRVYRNAVMKAFNKIKRHFCLT